MKTFKKLFIVIIIISFCTFPTKAISSKQTWNVGEITLRNETILEGNLAYNWLAEIIMLRQYDGRVRTFSADQVKQFGWFDYTQHKYRNFSSLSASSAGDRPIYTFFEVCADGSLAIVRHLKRPHGLFKRAFGHPGNYSDGPVLAQNPDQFTYYVHKSGRLRALDHFYTDIYLPLMHNYDRQIQHYIIQHNINSHTILGQLVLINYYNFLAEQANKTASVWPEINSTD